MRRGAIGPVIESPLIVNTTVNSPRFNGEQTAESAAMNETSEVWSLPWHALQRRLAERLGFELHGARPWREPAPSPRSRPLVQGWFGRARRLAQGHGAAS